MRMVRMSDVTLKQKSAQSLSFREKLELIRILDRLQVDVIELREIDQLKADTLFIKTVCEAVGDSVICVETAPDREAVDTAWNALKNAKKARIQIKAPVSLVQMDYLFRKKPEAVKAAVVDAISHARTLTGDVEFAAVDATRAERAFLYEIMEAAAQAGASTITACDTAGNMLPEEFTSFVNDIKANVPSCGQVALGFCCSDEMKMADACAVAAMIAGGEEVKVSIYPDGGASLRNIANIIHKKGSENDIEMNVRTVELKRLCDQAARMFTTTRSKTSPFENGVREDISGRYFTVNDNIAAIISETKRLGYDLSEEDQVTVYNEFIRIAEKKEHVTAREIDAIVASSALQVPPVYQLESYIINACNMLSATAQIRIRKNGEPMESVALGDGPVDASFLAIEQITGRHYELDDFQIQAVTEGREAMGETIVKLRSEGKLYSGRGLSTDILASSLSAYINALNKIAYEEGNE